MSADRATLATIEDVAAALTALGIKAEANNSHGVIYADTEERDLAVSTASGRWGAGIGFEEEAFESQDLAPLTADAETVAKAVVAWVKKVTT